MKAQAKEIEVLARRISTLIEQASSPEDAAELVGVLLGHVLFASEIAFKKPLPMVASLLSECMQRYAKSRGS